MHKAAARNTQIPSPPAAVPARAGKVLEAWCALACAGHKSPAFPSTVSRLSYKMQAVAPSTDEVQVAQGRAAEPI